MRTLAKTMLASAFCVSSLFAADGISLLLHSRSWGGPVPERLLHTQRGKLVIHQVENSKVVGPADTLTDYLALKPSLNIYGTHVGFFREDLVLKNNEMTGSEHNCHISVIGINGEGLEDIVEVDCPGRYANLDWPHGDWIYYERVDETKGTSKRGTGEIWRANVSTKTKEMVMDYTDNNDEQLLMRFSLTADAKHAAVQLRGFDRSLESQFGHWFHYPEGATYRDSIGIINTGCNQYISPLGEYIAGYKGGGHTKLYIYHWPDFQYSKEIKLDHLEIGSSRYGGITRQDQANWAGISLSEVGDGANFIKWSVNSEKWVMEQTTVYGGVSFHPSTYTVRTNWVDKECFVPPQTPTKETDDIHYHNAAGDFWVRPPEGKNGMVEKIDGTWVSSGMSPASDASAALPKTHSPRKAIRPQGTVRSVVLDPHIRSANGVRINEISGTRTRTLDLRGRVR